MSNYYQIGYYVNDDGARYCSVFTQDFSKVLEKQQELSAENEYFRAYDMIEVVSEEEVDSLVYHGGVWNQAVVV